MRTIYQKDQNVAAESRDQPQAGNGIDYLSVGLFVVAIAGYLLIGLHWLRPVDFILWLVFSFIAALPGWALWRVFGGRGCFRRLEFWAGGMIFGWAISSYAILIVGYLVGSARLWPLWVLAVASIAGWVIFRRRDRESSPILGESWSRGEIRLLAFTLAVVMVFIARPFGEVGALTADGYAFPWLFGFDFTNRVSIAANAAVSLPPSYFHIHGETFYYYLLTYMVPVTFKQFTGASAEMFSSMVLWCTNLTVVFTILLVAVLRIFVKNRKALLLSVLTIFVSYSFYWMYVAAKTYARANQEGFPATVGGGSWMNYSAVSHLLYRYFLVEPQTVFGFAILLLVLGYFLGRAGRLRSWPAGIGLGLSFGFIFGADALLTVWAGLGLGLLALFDLAQTRENRVRTFAAWVAAAAVFTVMAVLYYQIGMYSSSGSQSVIISLHSSFAKIFPLFMVIEFGPLLILGLIGGWYLLNRHKPAGVIWWLLTATAVFAVLFVQAQYDDQLGLLKGSRFLLILFALAAAVFWQRLIIKPPHKAWYAICIAMLLLALPTWATDWLKTSDTTDRAETVYIYPPDYQACQWIKAELPADAKVQSSPGYTNYRWTTEPAPYVYPLIANFAERPMAVGCWGMPQMLPNIQGKFYRIIGDIKDMYAARGIEPVLARLNRYGIDYLYYGPLERMRWPGFESLLASHPATFAKVYDHDEVTIYRVVR